MEEKIMNEVEQRILELMENEAFLQEMLAASTPEELVEVYNRNNLVLGDISPEEAFQAVQAEKAKAEADDELSEEDLDNVAGGSKVYFALKIAKGCFYVAASGGVGSILLTVGGIAAIGLASYAAYRYIKKNI